MNGSLPHVSIAQNGIGRRTQFKPAPAISAKSSSVCGASFGLASAELEGGLQITHDEGFVVVLELRKSAVGGVCSHSDTDGPLINSGRLVFLEKRRGDERLKNEPATEVDTERFDR